MVVGVPCGRKLCRSGAPWCEYGACPTLSAASRAHAQAKLAEATSALQARCEMGTYTERTPEAVKAADAEKLAKLQAETGMLNAHLAAMRAML